MGKGFFEKKDVVKNILLEILVVFFFIFLRLGELLKRCFLGVLDIILRSSKVELSEFLLGLKFFLGLKLFIFFILFVSDIEELFVF